MGYVERDSLGVGALGLSSFLPLTEAPREARQDGHPSLTVALGLRRARPTRQRRPEGFSLGGVSRLALIDKDFEQTRIGSLQGRRNDPPHTQRDDMALILTETSIREAKAYVAAFHRHAPKILGGKIAIGVTDGAQQLRGVEEQSAS